MSEYRIENRTSNEEITFDTGGDLNEYCVNHKNDDLVVYEVGRWGETKL